jgi:hypothetical protein
MAQGSGNEEGQSSQLAQTEEVVVSEPDAELGDDGGEDDSARPRQQAREPTGEADEAEENEQMQQLIEHEDLEQDHHEQHGNSDEESGDDDESNSGPIPSGWNQALLGGMCINDGHDSRWEYRQNEIRIGTMYRDKVELKNAVNLWGMSTQRTFKTRVSCPQSYTAYCTAEGCKCIVHAYVPKYEVNWVVSNIVPHTCVRSNVLAEHRNLSSTLIATLMFNEIVEKKDMEAKHIQVAIRNRYKYRISYGKAWRAKQKAMEMRYGSFIDSYDNLPRLLRTLQERNPGTYIDIQHSPSVEWPRYKVLHRAFFSLGPCIEAFRHCRPVLCVDGTFLTGKFKGQILTAIGVDGNNQILPLAMAFVESENFSSWLWFFRSLKHGVVKNHENVCIIHDRHPGILKAIKTLQQPSVDEMEPWHDLQSRWCMRHLGANFFSQFKNKRLMNLFKRLCRQNQEKKFNSLWAKLDAFTEKEVKERRKKASSSTLVNTEDEPRELCALPEIDTPGLRRKKATHIKKFSHWIEKEPHEKWSLLHDTHGARYGIMTTNLAEVYNFVLRGQRNLPLVAIVEGVLHGTVRYFQERLKNAILHINSFPATPFCAKIMTYMADKIAKGQNHTVYTFGNVERRFEIRLRDNCGFGSQVEQKTHEVTIGMEEVPTCICTCNKPKLFHLPCSHVLAACGQIGMESSSFVSSYFLKETVYNTWCGEIRGYRAVGNYNTVVEEHREYIPDFGLMRQCRGRRKVRRIRNDMDESEVGGPTRQCMHCTKYGHRMRHCPELKERTQCDSTERRRGRGRRGRADGPNTSQHGSGTAM